MMTTAPCAPSADVTGAVAVLGVHPPSAVATSAAEPVGLLHELRQLPSDAALIYAVERDKLKLKVRETLTRTAVLVLSAALLFLVLAAALIMVLCGTALGLAELCGGRLWLGTLLTGSLTTFMVAALALRMHLGLQRKAFEKTRALYTGRMAPDAPGAPSENEFLKRQSLHARAKLRARTGEIESVLAQTSVGRMVLAHPVAASALAAAIGTLVVNSLSAKKPDAATEVIKPIEAIVTAKPQLLKVLSQLLKLWT